MTKRDYIWVALKVFGLYLLVEAIIAIPVALSTVIYFFTQHNISNGTTEMDRLIRSVNLTTLNQLVSSLLRMVICGGFGIYFIKGGHALLKLICPPESEPQQP